jgi:Putative zinc-finger domain
VEVNTIECPARSSMESTVADNRKRALGETAKPLGQRIFELLQKYTPDDSNKSQQTVLNPSASLVCILTTSSKKNWTTIIRNKPTLVLIKVVKRGHELSKELIKQCREFNVPYCVAEKEILAKIVNISKTMTGSTHVRAICLTTNLLPEDAETAQTLQETCYFHALQQAGSGYSYAVERGITDVYRRYKAHLLVSTGDAVRTLVETHSGSGKLLILFRGTDRHVEAVRALAHQCLANPPIPFLWVDRWDRLEVMVDIDPAATNVVCLSIESAPNPTHQPNTTAADVSAKWVVELTNAVESMVALLQMIEQIQDDAITKPYANTIATEQPLPRFPDAAASREQDNAGDGQGRASKRPQTTIDAVQSDADCIAMPPKNNECSQRLDHRVVEFLQKYGPSETMKDFQLTDLGPCLVTIFGATSAKEFLRITAPVLVLVQVSEHNRNTCKKIITYCLIHKIAHCVAAPTRELKHKSKRIVVVAADLHNILAFCLTSARPEDAATLAQLQAECHDRTLARVGAGFCDTVESAITDFYRRHIASKKVLITSGSSVYAVVQEMGAHLVLVDQSGFRMDEIRKILEECLVKRIPFFWVSNWAHILDIFHVDPMSMNVVCLSRASRGPLLDDFEYEFSVKALQQMAAKSKGEAATDPAFNATPAEQLLSYSKGIHDELCEIGDPQGPTFRRGLLATADEAAREKKDTDSQDEATDSVQRHSSSDAFGALPLHHHQEGRTILAPSSSGLGAPVERDISVATDWVKDKEILLRLEEEIALLEASIETLNSRRTEVNQSLLNAETEQSHLLIQADVLQHRSEHLSAKQQKQASLQQKLDLSISQSKKRLERLTAPDVTVEEIEQFAAGKDAEADFVDDLDQKTESAAIEERVLLKEGIDLPPALHFADEGEITAPRGTGSAEKSTDELEQLVSCRDADEDLVNELQSKHASTGSEEREIQDNVVLPVSASFVRVQVERTTPDTNSSESTLVPKQNWTREDLVLGESFFPTEADLSEVSMPDINLFWNVARDETVAEYNFLACIASETQLKSMLDLAARETLSLDALEPSGRHRREAMRNTCIDAHLMANTGFPTPALTPVSTYRVATEISSEVTEGRRVDPNVPLCPFELAGICADPDCSYQHLEKRSIGSVLPRELVPLPKIRLDALNQNAAQQKAIDDPSLNLGVRPGSLNESVARPTDDDGHDGIAKNSDFIALPEADEPHQVDDVHCDETINVGFFRLTNDSGRPSVWWMDTRCLAQVRALPKVAHMSDLLSAFGVVLAKTKLKEVLCFRALDKPSTTVDGCLYAGMILDCARLAIHAGRFDVSRTLHELTYMIHTRYGKSPERPILNSFSRMFSSLCITLLESAGSKAFAFGSKSSKTSFLLAFESQVQMALGSFCFDQFHMSQGKYWETLSNQAFCLWHSAAATIMEEAGLNDANLSSDEIAAAIKSECSIEDDFQPPADVYLMRVDFLLHSVRVVSQLRPGISQIASIRILVDDILYPSFNEVKKMFQLAVEKAEAPTRVVLKGVILLANVVFGALESAANQLRTDEQMGGVNTALRELHSVIDKILTELRALSSSLPMMDLLLSPVFAANVALAVSIKLYDSAHYRLESLLGKFIVDNNGGSIGRTLAPYSELLWSQMIQLRASLPTRSVVDSTASAVPTRITMALPKDLEDNHIALSNFVSKLGVYPHHVSLGNDWNIVKALIASGILKANFDEADRLDQGRALAFYMSCRSLHRSLTEEGTNEVLKFNFGNKELKLRGSHCCWKVKSAIPHSLLLAGPSMIELDISATGLRRLPLHFGLYFPNLQVRWCLIAVKCRRLATPSPNLYGT